MNFIFNQYSTNESVIYTDIFKELAFQLLRTKQLIDICYKEWDIAKKMIHEYEYVYTSSYYKKNISTFSPISRSYFKLTEMIQDYQLLNEDKKYKVACLAEAPGGFIQSLLYTKKIEEIHAITLLSKDKRVPYWNKSLINNPSIVFHRGIRENGDLYDFKNVLSFIKSVGQSSVDLITGDGGFDYSEDYNKQEYNSLRLIYSEIYIALNLQKKNGSFVCKLFDIFLKETIELLFILYLSYDQIIIHKPCISRLSNSEKYIICKGFKGYNKDYINQMTHSFQTNQLNIPIHTLFIRDLQSFNETYIHEQIKHIKKGIELIEKKELISTPSKIQLKDAIDWCRKYNLNVNLKCIYLNDSFK
tara:strand:+ start:1512 stop:2588 length:1077 start_codon:yes stop_codon:yes gene_type:complete